MLKTILLFTISINAYSWSIDPLFDGEQVFLQNIIFDNNIKPTLPPAKAIISDILADKILKDEKNRVNNQFHIPDYFRDNVYFWFSIYTQFNSHHVVIHDKKNLDIVYEVIDFNSLKESIPNPFIRFKKQAILSLDKAKEVKESLVRIGQGETQTPTAKKYIRLISSVLKIPENKKEKKEFFKQMALNIRTQTGQRDMIYNGVLNVLPYLSFLEYHFKYFELPHEMLAIPFLESSFNPKARSRVNAAGVWQIMPFIAAKLMPRKKRLIDTRLNPIIASIAAFHLLKQNYKILDRWDLAVTAYNSGTKHLLKAKRQLADKYEHSLENIFKHYKSDYHGFASKNFYSEFLALVHVLAYKDIIFPLEGNKDWEESKKDNHTWIYVSRCPINPIKFFKKYKKESPHIKDYNLHFLNKKRTHPRGTLVVADIKLPENNFYKLSPKETRRQWPRNWWKNIEGKRCRK